MKIIDTFTGPYRFLSNFYLCVVTLDGERYDSTEHAYQAAKTFDLGGRFYIRHAATPGKAKAAGKHVVLRADWETVKLTIMEDLLRQKFNQAYFAELLKATGDAELIEGNHWGDTFWGVCKGVGENHLGKLLMKIRSEL